MLADENGKLNPGKQFAAGAGAGVLEAIFAVTPIETVKTKSIQLNMGFVQGVKHIVATDGPRGLYQGVGATILKQASNQGLRFMAFNEYKKRMSNDGKRVLHPLENLAGGMAAGCFSTMGNNPFGKLKFWDSVSSLPTPHPFLSSPPLRCW
jgi:solute carrier family 25 citrate transporter 1